ncbi:MAG: hypothetical protein IJ222_01260 [Bacteroidales bacterium]|nr:hypothetical protein [Bacteroidales bacterium]
MSTTDEIIRKYAALSESVPEFGPWLISDRDSSAKDAAMAELWDSLEAELALTVPPKRKAGFAALLEAIPNTDKPVAGRNHLRVLIPLVSAAAAALVFFLLLHDSPVPELPVPEAQSSGLIAGVVDLPEPPALTEAVPVSKTAISAYYNAGGGSIAGDTAAFGTAVDVGAEDETASDETAADEAVVEEPILDETLAGESSARDDETVSQWRAIEAEEAAVRHRMEKRKPTFSASLSGVGMSSESGSVQGIDLRTVSDRFPTLGFTSDVIPPGKAKVHYRNFVPLTAGLDFTLPLTNWLDLRFGAAYSLLHSKITTTSAPVGFGLGAYSLSSEEDESSQTLHYLGVPLSLRYSFVRTPHFGVYAAAGGTVAKCIAGAGGHPWQLSANLAGGAEYMFNNLSGIYFEPSLNYYFDDSSPIVNYYSSQPLSLGLKLGLLFRL